MSWIEKLKKGLVITTGDGGKFFPLYKMNPKTTDFNVAEFEFPNIEGTLVKRSLVKGTKMKLEFYFQGEEHLTEALRFENSAKDKRPFKILHPFFGKMTVQPTSLQYDSTGLGLTKITGDFIETISDEYPRLIEDPKNKIALDVLTTNLSLLDLLDELTPELADATIFDEFIEKAHSIGDLVNKANDQYNEYKKLHQSALGAIDFASAKIGQAAQKAMELYNYPSKFVASITDRIEMFKDQLDSIFGDLSGLVTPNEKKIAEFTGGAIVSSMINATIFPNTDDYQTSNEVIASIDLVLSVWDSYVIVLEQLQTETNDTEDSYVPDFNTVQNLINLVNFATANLINIALNSSSERSFILESDSNAIILAHRFYGLSDGDKELNKFINQNNLSVSELLEIKKGKRVVYYI